jgi:hypothetical protein
MVGDGMLTVSGGTLRPAMSPWRLVVALERSVDGGTQMSDAQH